MVRLSEEKRKKIIELYNNNTYYKDILEQTGISKSVYYKFIKEYNDNNKENEEYNDNNNVIEENNDNNNNESDEYNNVNEEYNENEEDEENNNVQSNNENISQYEKDEFIKELNSEKSIDNVNDINQTEIDNNDNKIINENYLLERKRNKNNKSLLNNSTSVVSFKQTYDNKSTILDTIKNITQAGTIDELKQKRNLIIIIRQYINSPKFTNTLKNIYVNKTAFEKKLDFLSIDQLKVLLENIRITINLSRNRDLFTTTIQVGLKGIETISTYSGYDVSGLTEDLMKDEDFLIDLEIISAETNLSNYINPKQSAFLKVVKRMYMKNKENKIKKDYENVLNDKDKLEKIKNLSK